MAVLYNNLTGRLDDWISVLKNRLGLNSLEQDVSDNQSNISSLQTQANTNTNFSVPQGGIIIWSGIATAIPSGWALCNGSNGTPDLRGRFVTGATTPGDTGGLANYNVGDTGGANQVTLTQNEMPSHTHNVNDPGHEHAVPKNNTDGTTANRFRGGDVATDDTGFTNVATTGITLDSTGNGAPHENRPPYYALAYIMKL